MAPGFALEGVAFVALNEIRYRTWFDLTWSLAAGDQPLFQLNYLPRNIYALFFRAPALNSASFPILHPRAAGQALTFLSPAFLLALRPDFRKIIPFLVLAGVLIAMLPNLFFVYDGAPQVGARHFVSVFPLLLVLMAMGMPRRPDQLTKILIVASVVLVGFTVWHAQVWGFVG